MPDDTTPNSAMPQAPVEGVSPVNPMPQVPVVESPVVPPQAENVGVSTPPVDVSPQVPQGQDKSDAMTYPLGSQDAQPGLELNNPVPEEDHRSILERIIGIFSKGKKDQPENVQSGSVDQTPTNTSSPLGQ